MMDRSQRRDLTKNGSSRLIETLDLKDEGDNEDENFTDLTFFSRILKKKTPWKLHFNTVIFIEGNLKALSDREMIW